MSYYIGVDLGTSSVKLLLLSERGVEKTASRAYAVAYPRPGWSEQNPEDWYAQTLDALRELLRDADPSQVKSLSFSGQMHGLVALDGRGDVLRPAILWNDGRTQKQTDYLNEAVGRAKLLDWTGNIAFAGFTAPKILWLQENEPENFRRADKFLLPKDYLAYRLTGHFCTDVSDASGTLYFDVARRRWSREMLEVLGIEESQLPAVLESAEQCGVLRADIADMFGLPRDVVVHIGAGDNAAAAVGTGVTGDGACNISLGTSGTIFVASGSYKADREHAIHSFCSAAGDYHYLACILSAAACNQWWVEGVGGGDYAAAEGYRLGENDVLFLPCLTGERSPHNDPAVRAMFYGMGPATTREDMHLAVLEGVAFALRENLDIIRALGVEVTSSKLCGGGAKSRAWGKILANVLGLRLEIPAVQQGAALGAALLAAQGVMAGDDYAALRETLMAVRETIEPDAALAAKYEEQYRRFLRLYPAAATLRSDTLPPVPARFPSP